MFGLSRISAWGVADPLPTAPFTIFGLSPAPLIVIAGVALLIVLIPVISAWGVADPLPTAPFTIFGLSPAPLIVIAGVALLIVLIPVESWMEREHDVAILPSSFIKSAQVRSGVVAIALPFFYMGAQGLVATSFYQLVVGPSCPPASSRARRFAPVSWRLRCRFSTWAHKALWPRPSISSWSVSAAPARRFWASFRACRCSCSPWVFPASSPRRIPGSWCDAVTSLSPSARLWRPLAFGAPS